MTRRSPAAVMTLPRLPARIVRNFQMRNGLPFLPTLVWLKKTGRAIVHRIARASAANTGTRNSSPAAAHVSVKKPVQGVPRPPGSEFS